MDFLLVYHVLYAPACHAEAMAFAQDALEILLQNIQRPAKAIA
jgi:hypothetical protein